jgi:pyridoxamine 5'-phosphate oxidase
METTSFDIFNDLNKIEKDCWLRLEKGALESRGAMRTPVVANTNAAGINMRTVILRNAQPGKKQLTFYTDIRSGKWKEIQQTNNTSWLFYDEKTYIQIRASGSSSLHHDDATADEAWANNNITNRKNYLSILIPSENTNLPENELPTDAEPLPLSLEQSEAGRKNFGLVITQIKWMEWLWLNKNGHRRANFIYEGDGDFTANWLVH